MSEHEQLPDPMPKSPEDRQRIEALLGEMHDLDVQMAQEGEAAEVERIAKEIADGRSAGEILDELEGLEEAARIIGEEAVADLEAIDSDAIDEAELAAKTAEKEAWVEIYEMLDNGASDQDLVDAFKDRGGLERIIGSTSAKLIMEKAKKEKTNG